MENSVHFKEIFYFIDMKKHHVPFFGNPDNTHCFQATIRMALENYCPKQEYSWEQLDELSGKKLDKWTWRTRGLLELHKRGMEIINWGNFIHKDFVERGEDYLIEFFGAEKAKIQIEHCDLGYEIENAREMLGAFENRYGLPEISDIKNLLDIGYLVICNVNSKILNNLPGYSGHFILIYEVTDEHIVMHDPGPPHFPDRKVSYEHFLRAWEYPSTQARNLFALR